MKKIEGVEDIQKFLLSLLNTLENGSQMKSILTGKPLVYYFWDDFAEQFMQKRVMKNITLKSLRLTKANFDTEEHKNYSWYLKEVKHIFCDEEMDGDVIFIYGSTVIIFDTVLMTAEFFEWSDTFDTYVNFFQKYWDR